uniref:NADH:ubiquinone reductase (H(+)-translocating) n=1 Tax=Hoilungia sp. H24 TaxID=2781606 RepID=A0A7U3NGE3_9METZ|nr:NADH dehydrogenase subunit 2 [Hoilungia sp. H24]
MNNPRDLFDPMISMITQFVPILVITLAIFIILLRPGRPEGRPRYIYIAFFATLIAFFITIQGAPLGRALWAPDGFSLPLKDLWGAGGAYGAPAPGAPAIENSGGGVPLPWILMNTATGGGARPFGAPLPGAPCFGANLSDILSNYFFFNFAMNAYGMQILGLKGDSLSELSFGMIKENTYWVSECVILLSLMGLLFLTNEKGSGLALVLIVGLGGLLLIESANWLTIYLALEFQTLALFILAGNPKGFPSPGSVPPEGGLKYWILGAMSSGFYLFGCALYFGFTGSEGSLGTILSATLETTNIELRQGSLGYLFITVAILFKLAAAPFHMWTPDVYEGAPTPTTALIAIIPKYAAFVLLTSLVITSKLLLSVAIISLIVGAFGALNQTRVKRLLAYSGIGHIGFVLIGVSAGTYEGLQASWTYILVYLITTLASFTVICTLEGAGGSPEGSPPLDKKAEKGAASPSSSSSKLVRKSYGGDPGRLRRPPKKGSFGSVRNYNLVRRLVDLTILSRGHPYSAFSLAVIFLSLAGIPPLLGFLGKWFILVGSIKIAFSSSLPIYYLVALFAIICTCVSAFYYIRIVATIYFNFTRPLIKTKTPLSFILTWESILGRGDLLGSPARASFGGGKSILISIYIYFIIFIIICPQPLLLMSHEAGAP